jgi:drug/metabolite transporter (DMT)-like permease
MSGLILAAYVIVSGLRSTVLKGLQLQGAAHAHAFGGENPISFCNVFLISQLMIGAALLITEPADVGREIAGLRPRIRLAIACDSFLGCFLAPLAFYLALDQLSVITQTLLFSLTLPASALLALWWLKERLPERFALSLALILAGLVVGRLFGSGLGMGMDQLPGLLWALVAVIASATRNCLRRRLADQHLSRGLTGGVTNLAGALVFGLIALLVYGPHHFVLLQLWWVVGVIVLYGLTLSLGTEILRQLSTARFTVTQVAFGGSASAVVTVLTAAAFLHEPLTPGVLASLGLILAGVLQRQRPRIRPAPS